ncbi:hypothetical protein KUL25_02530 [Rhodobacteraceae bacterium N5(2021)]|uniref:Uncharacterized protein n=1 Tax=Gymnodinialimonas phycosphaerae TaxID=2841589 RepID=A0A975TWD6_9RHOB|nr:hypothetical protein [Gymnodinialimonas phycosphaerae]MBY4891636.1 hypothetical protein [Gymnodinialimonas phycosphaerae]
MPNLGKLALRYLLWLIGLRILYSFAVQGVGLPNLPAVGVILATVPALDVARAARQMSAGPLALPEWAKLWGLCLALFAAVQIILPAIILAPMRAALATPEYLQVTASLLLATAAMLAVFLWIGARIGGPRG